MKKKIAISTVVACFVVALLCAPSPDPFSMLVLGGAAAFFCAVPLLIFARFAFMRTASKPVHTLVCVLVCLVAILSVECFLLTQVVASQQHRLYREANSSSTSSVRVENTSHDAPAL